MKIPSIESKVLATIAIYAAKDKNEYGEQILVAPPPADFMLPLDPKLRQQWLDAARRLDKQDIIEYTGPNDFIEILKPEVAAAAASHYGAPTSHLKNHSQPAPAPKAEEKPAERDQLVDAICQAILATCDALEAGVSGRHGLDTFAKYVNKATRCARHVAQSLK